MLLMRRGMGDYLSGLKLTDGEKSPPVANARPEMRPSWLGGSAH